MHGVQQMNLLSGLGNLFRLKISYTNLLYSMILVVDCKSQKKMSVAYVLFLVFVGSYLKDSAVKTTKQGSAVKKC